MDTQMRNTAMMYICIPQIWKLVVCGRVEFQQLGSGQRKQCGVAHIMLLHAMAGWHSLVELAASNNGFAQSWKHSVSQIELYQHFKTFIYAIVS